MAGYYELGGAVAIRREVERFRFVETRYGAGTRIPRHAHQYASVSVVLAGAYLERIGGRERECVEGLALTHPAGESHANTHGGADVRLLTISWATGLGFGLDGLHLLEGPREHRSHEVARCAGAIVRELRNSDTSSGLALAGLSFELIACIERSGGRAAREKIRPLWLARVAELIRDEPASLRSVAELSAEAGVHPSHLAKAFRRYYGMSLGAYARRARLEWARGALASTQDALATIAADAGFADQSHFSRCFRDAFGLPPGRWRSQAIRPPAGRF